MLTGARGVFARRAGHFARVRVRRVTRWQTLACESLELGLQPALNKCLKEREGEYSMPRRHQEIKPCRLLAYPILGALLGEPTDPDFGLAFQQ